MKKDISLIYLMLIIILLQQNINYYLNILWKFGGSKHSKQGFYAIAEICMQLIM